MVLQGEVQRTLVHARDFKTGNVVVPLIDNLTERLPGLCLKVSLSSRVHKELSVPPHETSNVVPEVKILFCQCSIFGRHLCLFGSIYVCVLCVLVLVWFGKKKINWEVNK